MASDSVGRRCSAGCETWPLSNIYKTCPICKDATKPVRGVEPLSLEDAKSIRLIIDFEEYYENEWTHDETPLDDETLKRIEAWPERFEIKPKDEIPAKSEDLIQRRGGSLIGGRSGRRGGLSSPGGATA